VSSKFCKTCEEEKPIEDFGLKKGKGGNYYPRYLCNPCHTKYNLANRKKSGRKTSAKTSERARERALGYYYENRYTQSFKVKVCANAASYRSAKLHATPPWITEFQNEEIKNFYWLSRDLAAVSGEIYHVDHIVPLQGKNICGLHVPWNLQILPADINLSKGNSYANDA